jgi:DnaJ-class molecular chaperone
MDRREICPECDGMGVDPWGGTCLTCGGQGRVPYRVYENEPDDDE